MQRGARRVESWFDRLVAMERRGGHGAVGDLESEHDLLTLEAVGGELGGGLVARRGLVDDRELVDDAVVDVENIIRRLRENLHRPVPRPINKVIFDASREVRSGIVYSTFIIVLVFVPLFAIPGLEGGRRSVDGRHRRAQRLRTRARPAAALQRREDAEHEHRGDRVQDEIPTLALAAPGFPELVEEVDLGHWSVPFAASIAFACA